ncbi:nucleopolyhedrovirus P10 family protein, partial [Streptomyces sp. SAS_269]
MTADRWTRMAGQHRLALGRLLPLGGPRDGAWIAEGAVEAVLDRAANEVPGVRLGTQRITLADPDDVPEPVVPRPPGALPPGALRVAADFAAPAAEPLPATASRLRLALLAAATDTLGL